MRRAAADPATAFLVRALVWFVGLLGLLRLPWVQTRLLLPYTRLQAGLAESLLGERLQVFVAASCSGSDAMAVCLGAILAFPASWRRRLAAASGGLALITAVNTVRIAHLSTVADHPELLDLFHRRVWPAVIILVAAGYAFAWMTWVTRQSDSATRLAPGRRSVLGRPSWVFLSLAGILVTLYYAFYDRLLASALLGAAAERTAWLAAGLMGSCGIPAKVAGRLFETGSSTWMVTPECVTTPLIPIALAAALAAPIAWRWRLLSILLLPFAFQILAVARLMVLALPRALVGSPSIAVHAFYQVLVAALLVLWMARRREGTAGRTTGAIAGGLLAAAAVGALDILLLRPLFEAFADGLHMGHDYADPQGVLLLLPAFQSGLLVALWAAARSLHNCRELGSRLALILVAAILARVLLGELSIHTGTELPVVVLRAWSLALPLALTGLRGRASDDRQRKAGAGRQAPSPVS